MQFTTECGENSILYNEEKPEGRKNAQNKIVRYRPKHNSFDDDTHRTYQERSDEKRYPKATAIADDLPGEHGPQHVEGSMGDINDA